MTLPRLLSRAKAFLHPPNDPRGDGHCPRPPQWLILCVNNVCNLHCEMCDVGLGDSSTVFWANLIGSDPRNMSLPLFEEIVKQASRFRRKPAIGFAYTEPLIHPQIVDFVRIAKEAGFRTSVTTNGTTLERHAEALVAHGLDDLVVSIDGPEEVHDAIRGGKETFRRIVRGLERLDEVKRARKAERPRLAISFVVTPRSQGRILDFVKSMEPFRPMRIAISQLNFITDEMAARHNHVAQEGWKVVRSNLGPIDLGSFDADVIVDEIARVRAHAASRPGFPRLEIVPAEPTPDLLRTFYGRPTEFVGGRTCADPWTMMMVKTDGSVIPAHGRCFDVTVGDVTKEPLLDIWNAERFVGFRRTLRDAGGTLPACARCCGVIGKPMSASAL